MSRTSPAAVIIQARSPATTGPPLTTGSAAGTTMASALARIRSARGMTRRIGPVSRGILLQLQERRAHGSHARNAYLSGALRAIDVCRRAEEHLRRLHHRLRE